jgi:gliding motility-associated-like protein
MNKVILALTSCLIFFQTKAQINLNQGLAAYWNFNGNANDASGNNNNGIVNGATLVTDKWGNTNGAYYFNGVNNWIQIPNSPSLNFNSNSFTVYSLINVQGYYQGPCHGNSIIDRGAADNNPGAFNLRYADGYYTNGANCSNPLPDTLHENFIAGCSNVFNPSIVPPQYIQNNTWYCVIAVNDGTNLKVYVNGTLNYDATLNGLFTTSTEDIFIGRHNDAQFPYWMTAILDELRLYDRALNTQEIDSLCNYNPNAPVPTDDIVASFSLSYPANCDPKTVQFTDLSTATNATVIAWQWYFGDGGSSNVQNPLHSYALSGNYSVRLIATSSSNKKDTFDFPLVVGASPEFATTIGDTISCGEANVHLKCTGGVSYAWTPCIGANCNNSDYFTTIHATTQFIVQATDANGCIDIDTVFAFLTSNEEGVIVPNAFSPNGDGINDCIKVIHTTKFTDFYFTVYNRWGEKVFETDNPEECWNGEHKSKDAEMGAYAYFLKAETSCGKIFKKGDITLIR